MHINYEQILLKFISAETLTPFLSSRNSNTGCFKFRPLFLYLLYFFLFGAILKVVILSAGYIGCEDKILRKTTGEER